MKEHFTAATHLLTADRDKLASGKVAVGAGGDGNVQSPLYRSRNKTLAGVATTECTIHKLGGKSYSLPEKCGVVVVDGGSGEEGTVGLKEGEVLEYF